LIYAGKEDIAWPFLEENYRHADHDEYKTEVKKVLNKDSTYRSIYR